MRIGQWDGWVGRLVRYLTGGEAGHGWGREYYLYACLHFQSAHMANTKAKLNESKVKKHNGACLVPLFRSYLHHQNKPQPHSPFFWGGGDDPVLTLEIPNYFLRHADSVLFYLPQGKVEKLRFNFKRCGERETGAEPIYFQCKSSSGGRLLLEQQICNNKVQGKLVIFL